MRTFIEALAAGTQAGMPGTVTFRRRHSPFSPPRALPAFPGAASFSSSWSVWSKGRCLGSPGLGHILGTLSALPL